MSTPFFMRFTSYLKERFPLGRFSLLSLTLGAAVSFWSQREFSSVPAAFGPVLAGSVALLLFLFRLRLFDEFKDIEHDSEHYPDRAVPRGLVSLGELRVALVVCVTLEYALVARFSGDPRLFLVALGYSWLMYHEFFAREWLRRHFSAYIFTHELLAFPLVFHLAAMGVPAVVTERTWILAGFVTGIFFLLEVARKVRGQGVAKARDTYAEHYGVDGEAALIACAAAAAIVCSAIVTALSVIPWLLAIDTVAFGVIGVALFRHRQKRSIASAKAVFGAACLFAFIASAAFITGTLLS